MGYFSNGTEGTLLEMQCARCKYGEEACPIAFAQFEFNYDQLNDKTGTARQILNALISDDGTCRMFAEFTRDFEINYAAPLFPDMVPPIKYKEQ